MFKKIVKAAFSGKLINKTILFLFVKIPQKVMRKLDKLIALTVRYTYCLFSPIQKNKIVFMTYSNDYECNPKYIAEEIIRQGLPWDMVWVVPEKGPMRKSHFPPEIRRVRRNSYYAIKEIASAKIWVDNSINFLWDGGIKKKKNQVYFETWHGSMGIKRVGKNDVKNKKWVKVATKTGKITSYCISNSEFENGVYKSTHWDKTPILMYGHPRNDDFFKQEKMGIAKTRLIEKYKLNEDDKFLIYAPTFRDNGHSDCYDIDYEGLAESLSERFGGNWKILIRMHFHDRKKKLNKSAFPECVVNVTNFLDMQQLLLAVDAGITDYSSWAYDFILARKPLFIYATDLDEYNTERGLYYPLESTPFPIAKNNMDLMQAVLEFDEEKYDADISSFLKDKGCVEVGYAAERVVEKFKEIIGD